MVVTKTMSGEAQDKKSTNVTCYMICKNFYLRKCQSGGELGQLVTFAWNKSSIMLRVTKVTEIREHCGNISMKGLEDIQEETHTHR